MFNSFLQITFPLIWSICYFWAIFYIFGVFIGIVYIVSNVKTFFNFTSTRTNSNFFSLSGNDLCWFLLTPLVLFLVLNLSWSGPSILPWFGHLTFSSFQHRITYLILFLFTCLWVSYVTSLQFSSKEVYDYTTVTYSLFIWTILLFYTNNLFTTMFFIELLSTLIMLLVITSTFSTTHYYNVRNLTHHGFFNTTTPYSFLHTVIFFFWISLIGSLSLFLFLMLFFTKFLTFDWFLCESVFHFILFEGEVRDVLFTLVIWVLILFCIFLKCGLPPFFFWKPVFFKGLPLHTLFFYVFFFYFFIYFFFIYFFLIYLSDLFYYLVSIHGLLLLVGLLTITTTLLDSYYLKTFIAMSSILNSMFVFLAMAGITTVEFWPNL